MDNKFPTECFAILLCGLVVMLLGISAVLRYTTPNIPMEPEKIMAEQVMQHDSHCYSFKYKAKDNELIEFHLGRNPKVRLIADVPEGESMFVLIERGQTRLGEVKYLLEEKGAEIHIHSAAEINGGGWDYGKRGRGQTVAIDSN